MCFHAAVGNLVYIAKVMEKNNVDRWHVDSVKTAAESIRAQAFAMRKSIEELL